MDRIIITGAKHNNLKNINLEILKNKITVITGLSGSGKSSLAFDTLYAEGQRRYIETLSAYARQFIKQLSKPEVDKIEGLSPSISIEQRTIIKNPRSTVGTVSEIYDYLRLLYSKVGTLYCSNCKTPIDAQENSYSLDQIIASYNNLQAVIMSPIVRGRKGEYKKILSNFLKKGFLQCRIDKIIYPLENPPSLSKYKHHYIDIVIDKIIIKKTSKNRLSNAIETAKKYANNSFSIYLPEINKELLFIHQATCNNCSTLLPEVQPKLFSFNSPIGACSYCKGLGIIPDLYFDDLSDFNTSAIYENGDFFESLSEAKTCPKCKGYRLKNESLLVKINGLNISELCNMEIYNLIPFFSNLTFSGFKKNIADKLLKEIIKKLEFLNKVGLGYLTLDRPIYTLSAGEAQRTRLATQISSGLRGILYVLDEPTIGLHPKDNQQLLNLLKILKNQGNTIVIVEHDEFTIRSADYIIDLGPAAGINGGYIVNKGPFREFIKNDSITSLYLTKKKIIPVPEKRRQPQGFIKIIGAREHNLKNINVDIPLGVFVAVTGVSGSGKSTLIIDILYKFLLSKLYKSKVKVGKVDNILGWEKIKRVVAIDQSPIGKTPRSCPATYTSIWTHIREFYSKLPQSRMLGYSASRFSFNLKSGRCPSCQGLGKIKVYFHFMPYSYLTCEECGGSRFNKETLQIKYESKSIADILEMTIQESLYFFSFHPYIKQKLTILNDLALGYIKLGQPSSTLSGGESQRLKLSRELSLTTKNTLFILDEPTTGLHFDDVHCLIQSINKLVNNGNTIIVIEHNLDVIKSADYIIDLGPDSGPNGGFLVAYGSPEKVAKEYDSHTSKFLKDFFHI